MDDQLAAETKAMQEQALEVFKASGLELFRFILNIADVQFTSSTLYPEEAAKLFPSMMGNLYIEKVVGFDADKNEWETI